MPLLIIRITLQYTRIIFINVRLHFSILEYWITYLKYIIGATSWSFRIFYWILKIIIINYITYHLLLLILNE